MSSVSNLQLSEHPFRGKVVSVTGAGSGIGFSTSLILYARGANVAASDINPTGLARLEKSLLEIPAQPKRSFMVTRVDVSKAEEVNTWIDSIIAKYGRLDGCANVAGGADRKRNTADFEDSDFDHAVNINLRGVFNCMRAQLPRLPSSIVNVSSGAGIMGTPGMSLYSATKGGINSLSSAACKEYGAQGVRVNIIAPGITLTPAMHTSGNTYLAPAVEATPLKRGSEPLEQAKVISFLLSDEASFISGVVLRCEGGLAAMGH